MNGKPFSSSRRGFSLWVMGAVLGAAAWLSSSASAQSPEAPPAPLPVLTSSDTPATPPAAPEAPHVDPNVVQAGCASCSAGLVGAATGGGGGGCASGSCGGGCIPGRSNCFCGTCNCDSCVGRCFCALYDCICCPDPCYVPEWLPVADSAFFVDAARPVTQMRLRFDSGWGLDQPDRAEYIWARERVGTSSTGKGPAFVPSRINEQSLSLYSETAAGAFGLFVEVPYEHLDVEPIGSTSGFADMNIGTKAMLLDCQLLQLTFQFKTFIPTGNFTTGLGTAHVSLEPSLLFNVRLTPDCYLQGQFSWWIPIGGDQQYEGDVFHCHFSLNHKLWEPFPGLLFVGTLELNEWTVTDGEVTAPDGTPVAGHATMLSAGPGIRMFVCNKLDTGVGSAISLTGDRWFDELVRVDFRIRF